MRFAITTKLALTAVLAFTTLPVVAAAAPGADRPDRLDRLDRPPATASAQQALVAVEEAFEGVEGSRREIVEALVRDGRDATMRMLQLNHQLDSLSDEDRDLASAYLARPTDGVSAPEGSGYGNKANPISDCEVAPTPGSNVCVTWARRTTDAPPLDDEDGDDVPDQVEQTRDVVNHVWDRIVTQGGYRSPKRDSGPTRGQGPNRSFDVYLADLGDDDLYGYCNIDGYSPSAGRDTAGFCVLDDDYSPAQFPFNTPLQNLKVTVAHEFFHAVQFAYDVQEDPWFMEGSAAWIEDEIYDEIDDNYQFLARNSPMSNPEIPLDYFGRGFAYGSWVWWRFVAERFPAQAGTGLPVIIRSTWEAAHHDSPQHHGTYSLNAIAKSIAAHDANITRVFADFGEALRHPGSDGNFEEGRSYPRARLVDSYNLSGSRRSHPRQTAVMPHLTNWTVAFNPRDGLRSKAWKLRVHVNGPNRSRGPFAQLTSYHADGSIKTQAIKLGPRGVGNATVGFSSRSVRRVELTITNAGRRYRCNQGTTLSCMGRSLDNGLKTEFKATAAPVRA